MRVYNFQSVLPEYTTWCEPCIRKKYTISVYSYCTSLFGYSSIQHVLPVSNKVCVIRNSNCLPFAITWDNPLFFGGSVLLIFLIFCCICLRSVSCVPNVSSASGLSILDCPFDFL